MFSTLRVIEGGAWKLAAVKSDSKSWTARGIAGRFEPSGSFDKYASLPDSVIDAYLAVPFDSVGEDGQPNAAELRAAILAPYSPVEASSPVSFGADDYVAWAKTAGTRSNAGRMLAHGILVIPESTDNESAIDAVFATIGVESPFASEEPETEPETETETEPETVVSPDPATESKTKTK